MNLQATFWGNFYPRGSALPRRVVADIRLVGSVQEARAIAKRMGWTLGDIIDVRELAR